MLKLVLALAAAALMSACVSLSAEAPLFTTAHQIGPGPPIQEGVWVQIDDDCTERAALRRGRLPRGCEPFELRRAEDGAWTAIFIGTSGESADEIPPLRLIIAPAVEGATPQAYVRLYVAELLPLDPATEPRSIDYAVIAPLGVLPALEMYLVASIGCEEILRQGPIEGIAVTNDEQSRVIGCTASTQSAVRTAAQRAFIEQVDNLDEQRFVRVRD